MMNKLGLLFRLALSAGLLLLACDLLPMDEFNPTGSDFALNPDIDVVSITGNPDISDYGAFTLGMTVVSRSSSIETDTLDAGLLFARRQNNMQHMLVLKKQTVTASTTNTLVKVGVFCCNQHRPSPDVGDTFDLGPVTDNSGLKQLVELVRDKDISGDVDVWMVQRAVYLVTDSTGLTQAYIDSINALPPDTTD
jgi:hypothetical protein